MALRKHSSTPAFELRTGRRFRARPPSATVTAFLQFVWRTGRPHDWPLLTTTPHPTGEAPQILKPFEIPAHLRGGKEFMAPCSICSAEYPKFEHGFLVYCSDGRLRIIGHDCGHQFFEGESYADAMRQYGAETEEGTARNLLADRLPDLARSMLEAMSVARSLVELLSFRERLIASITQRAVAALRRSRIANQLTIEVPAKSTDEKGRLILERQVVSVVGGLDALVPRSGLLADLTVAIGRADSVLVTARDQIQVRLDEMNRHQAFAAAKTVQQFDKALNAARTERDNLCQLLSDEGLRGLSEWGRHSQCPTPFWIEIATGRRVFANKGVKPRLWDRGHFLQMPAPNWFETISVS
jgi:hypothetical protein